VATIEAMKMEASITAPVGGTVERIALSGTQAVDGGTSCWCSPERQHHLGRQKVVDVLSCPDFFRHPSRVGLVDPSP
jgi:hypothetical protein